MTKTLIAIFLAILGMAGLLAPAAEAGCGGGGYSSYRSYRPSYRSTKRHVRPKVTVAKRQAAKPVAVAKSEPEPPANGKAKDKTDDVTLKQATVSENSSITSKPASKVAEKKEVKAEKVASAAKDLGCKQFFPAVGMTLSVACQQ